MYSSYTFNNPVLKPVFQISRLLVKLKHVKHKLKAVNFLIKKIKLIDVKNQLPISFGKTFIHIKTIKDKISFNILLYIKTETKNIRKDYFCFTYCQDLMCKKDIKGQKLMCVGVGFQAFNVLLYTKSEQVIGN